MDGSPSGGRAAFVVPSRPGRPSGGDTYDAHVVAAWPRTGAVDLAEVRLAGAWPTPSPGGLAALDRALAGHRAALVDGLVACPAPAQLEAARARGGRVTVVVHLPLGAESGLTREEADRRDALERRALHAAHAVATTSRWGAQEIARRHGLAAHVALPGTVAGHVATGSDPPQLLVLGAISALKDPVAVVDALATAREERWAARIVGPSPPGDPTAATLSERIERHGLRDRVEVTGPATGEDLEAIWRQTDLLVLASRVEMFGLVVTEAVAHGIPAVVTAGTGATEALATVAGPTDLPGAVVPRADLAAVLRQWLRTPQLRREWRDRAHAARAGLRPWSATAADLAALLSR